MLTIIVFVLIFAVLASSVYIIHKQITKNAKEKDTKPTVLVRALITHFLTILSGSALISMGICLGDFFKNHRTEVRELLMIFIIYSLYAAILSIIPFVITQVIGLNKIFKNTNEKHNRKRDILLLGILTSSMVTIISSFVFGASSFMLFLIPYFITCIVFTYLIAKWNGDFIPEDGL